MTSDADKPALETKIAQMQAEREQALEAEKQARAKADAIYWPIYNLDSPNPHIKESTLGDPDKLLKKHVALQAEIDATLAQLQAVLAAALQQK